MTGPRVTGPSVTDRHVTGQRETGPRETGPRVVVLSGGVGGAKFTLGVREFLRQRWPDGEGETTAELSVICNVGDDFWLAGMRITPDLDSVMYHLAGEADTERGWGRKDESERVSAEMTAYGVGWPWFTLGDLDIGTHIARSTWLREGLTLSEVVTRLCARWQLSTKLIPATDAEVETRVRVGATEMHFEEWWVRLRGNPGADAFVQPGAAEAVPSPGALAAIAAADVILVAPSNPVVSIGTMIGLSGPASAVPGIPGLRDALRAAEAPIVGLSPVIAGKPLRGMADICLATLGIEADSAAIARAYGARSAGGLLDGWLIDEADAAVELPGIRLLQRPLLFTSLAETAAIAADAFEMALAVRG
ncbi:2-phospho-L-lactate transferase [Gulosibacter chungangensis]|uniref:2-phospho-L-lactate transferase n=1 Tax=Gulosibacter chungangensis TaxID=979746 RepID=A0A7J5BFU8_9MICO|nr:2-phospho-L-lactate transferase [Gulosibacter chungangensis]KAB1645151.1 2-phospho-L-lactate transferase [Gulosibacter chungangensis]